MTIKALTNEQHRNVLKKLVDFRKIIKGIKLHPAGPEYTSLMVCFLSHNLSSADCLLRLYDSFGDEYFPTTVGYTIVRPMFEIDVTGHYITRDAYKRAHQYILYESVLEKQQMDACRKHRNSKNSNWGEAMEEAWQHGWGLIQTEVNSRYDSVRNHFENSLKKGKSIRNWSGKSIRQMALEVEHEEAYDIFYADLSSFTHVDVRLANRFLRLSPKEGMSWSIRARPQDIGGVFRYAGIFLTCFLILFGQEFKMWSEKDVEDCWG